MIEVYSWATPNGHKVHVMLEECGLAVPRDPGQHRRRRPVQARVPRDQPEQQDPGDRRSRRARRPADLAVRIGRDPDLPGSEDRSLPARRPARPLPDARVADVPDGQRRADARPDASLPALRAREDSLRDRPLQQRSQAPLRRDGQAARSRRRTSPPTSTRSPTSRSSRGCARGRTRASTGPTIRTSRTGSIASQRGRRCSAASRFSPACASRFRTDEEREVLFGKTQYERR